MQNFTELYEVERRYEELAHRMSTPDAAANADEYLSLIHISEPTRRTPISYAVFCLKKKNNKERKKT